MIAVLAVSQCAVKSTPELKSAAALPRDILGISVGMNKDGADVRLREIGKLIRLEKKRQEVWTLKSDPRYGHLIVGYDKENKIRYVTAVAKSTDATPVSPSEIGSLADAKQETVQSSYKYVWQVPAREDKPAYEVTVRGDQPGSLSKFSLSTVVDENAAKEEEEEEK